MDTKNYVISRLSVMMFLQFFIWGGFFVTMGIYLLEIFEGEEGLNSIIGQAYATHNWAAVLAPVLVGLIADRYFNAERVNAVCHILGAALLWYAATITAEPGLFIWTMFAYFMLYMPTLALVNAISFANIGDPDKEFPKIRVWGTIGWIAAGFVVAQTILGWVNIPFLEWFTGVEAGIQSTSIPLQMSAIISLIYGLYSFTLPPAPPSEKGKKFSLAEALGLDAVKLLTNKNFAIFSFSSFAISIPLAFYYARTNDFIAAMAFGDAAPSFMTIGQMSEVLFMILIPFFLVRLGVKWMLLVGMLAWTARYFLFGFFPESTALLLVGIALHGVCYDFFFVTGQLYVEKKAPKSLRASAQGFFNLLTYGVGMLIGNYLLGWWGDNINLDGATRQGWLDGAFSFWIMPAAAALVVAIFFFFFFWDDEVEAETLETGATSIIDTDAGETSPGTVA
ncbi:MFS transporter [Rhodohalobacter mucosus]|uniref:MFS transporter n=1 Tax=Rhodohalobacter mucosus TaxID=2079485 RepID=A0A316U1C1_9BACT|nr:MFS transporter [Rhodohalobacter mucosus]PWN06696.1 MFS transporter [Rhodohalobacter mucosus]